MSTIKPRILRKDERRAKRPAQIDPAQLYGLEEGFAAIDSSRADGYKLIGAGRLKVVYIGKRPRIPGAEIIRFTADLIASGSRAA